jgi:hypothetical protein
MPLAIMYSFQSSSCKAVRLASTCARHIYRLRPATLRICIAHLHSTSAVAVGL